MAAVTHKGVRPTGPDAGAPLLEIRGLRTHFFTQDGTVKAVDGVSFAVDDGKTLGVVGESGCGKSITAMSILRLIGRPGKIVEGEILLDGRDLTKLSEDDIREVRGNQISMIFQEPMTSLNPVYTFGDQIAETVALHLKVSRREAMKQAIEMLRLVGIPDPKRRANEYPHQLSGGMRQRVMIAMALSTNPALLIADEPTTALDVTIQAQILELMKVMRARNQMAIMLITHDLGVIAEMADTVVVMYAGKVVENATVATIFDEPHHPYTKGLLNSIPQAGQPQGPPRGHPGHRPEPAQPAEGLPVQAALPLRDADLRHGPAAPEDLRGPSVALLADPRREAAGRRCRRPAGGRREGGRPALGGGMSTFGDVAGPTPEGPPVEGTTLEEFKLTAHTERPDRARRGAGPGRERRQALRDPRRLARHPPDRRGPGRRRCVVLGPTRRDPRPGRRVRLRQDDPRQGHAPPHRADVRQGERQRADDLRPPDGRGEEGRQEGRAADREGDGPGPAGHADRLPGPVCQPEPADDGRRDRRRRSATSTA